MLYIKMHHVSIWDTRFNYGKYDVRHAYTCDNSANNMYYHKDFKITRPLGKVVHILGVL